MRRHNKLDELLELVSDMPYNHWDVVQKVEFQYAIRVRMLEEEEEGFALEEPKIDMPIWEPRERPVTAST